MRNRKNSTMFVSAILAMALSLSACASDNDDNNNGGTVDPGTGFTTTTFPLDTTTLP